MTEWTWPMPAQIPSMTEIANQHGYAIPAYSIATDKRLWRFKNETFDLAVDAVPLHYWPDMRIHVAKIEDIRRANGT